MFEQTFKNIDDVLWKEAGCATELDYTEQTSWILFLKYLDDLERATSRRPSFKARNTPPSSTSRTAGRPGPRRRRRTARSTTTSALIGDDLIDYVNERAVPLSARLPHARRGPGHDRIQDRRDLRRDQEQVPERLFAARRAGTGRPAELPLAAREARALAPLRSQAPEHGQCRAQRRRILHAAPADPRHDQGDEPEDRRAHL